MKQLIYSFFLLVLISCAEDHIGQTPTDGTAPSTITAVEVESTPGGAKISYTIPKETDISYVKGVYYVNNREHVVRSSIYKNSLEIEGLGTTDPLDVTLYVVDHSENVSEPFVVTINPSTPIVDLILSSVKLQADFGGVNAVWNNELGSEIGLTIMAVNNKGELEDGETYYSNMKEGSYSFRGYDDVKRMFALYLTDKWGNISDTIRQEISPYYEMQLDKSKHKRLLLPKDNNTNYSGSMTFEKMFDESLSTMWHTAQQNGSIPIYFTVDLGVNAKLSRFKLYHRDGTSWFYKHYNPKTFEVWASDTYKDGMDDEYWTEEWKNDWVQVGDFLTLKPSGEGDVTNEDAEYASKGFEFSAPLDLKKVRYLRFVVKSTWSGAAYLHIAELTFWGNDQ